MELVEGCGSNSDVSNGSKSDATSDRIPARYVLLYTVDRVVSVPEGQLNLVLAPLNPDVNPEALEKCCSDYATWSDPHVYHPITLHCPRCNTNMEDLRINATISVGDELAPEKMNHLVWSCPNQLCEKDPATKVRILRRGRRIVIPGIQTPILEVEVEGNLEPVCDEKVGNYLFTLGVLDDDGGVMYRVQRRRSSRRGRWNFRVLEENNTVGRVQGLSAKWVNADWTDASFDLSGLRVVDKYCSVKANYPPENWTPAEENQEGDGEE